jgi:hypothetical protein
MPGFPPGLSLCREGSRTGGVFITDDYTGNRDVVHSSTCRPPEHSVIPYAISRAPPGVALLRCQLRSH